MRFILLIVFVTSTLFAAAQKKSAAPALDAEIAAMVKEISADSIKSHIQKMVTFGTRHSLSDTLSATTGIGAARRWVASKFLQFRKQSGANMTVDLDPLEVPGGRNARIPRRVIMKNVLGTLKGSDPNDDRVLLISGHLDSRATDVMDSVIAAPGANDDASGVAVVIELARVMSKHKFPCTIIFMAVQGEEQGLIGARHMAEKMKANKMNLIAMLNNDIVGNSTASETGDKNDKTVRVFSEMVPSLETDDEKKAREALKAENDSPSRQLARYIKEVAEPYTKGFTATMNMRPDRFLRGGDHTPFLQNGFVAVRFTEFNENFSQQHQTIRTENGKEYGDLLKHVDFAYAANVARLNLATLASLAKAPGKPQAVKMKVNLDNMSYLTWEAPASGPKPRGYNILIRETYQPFWEKKIFVADLKADLPYSKDNYYFAVQAVGEKDLTSQAVIPVPTR
ncbi:MAG TPA: M20/M25/M40 family metallo-hydrolase [Cyclobacteriaceae bacterium]|nr:M20/M25/M40 family metallo-hydrolase [Cyclobacteriaceae bacterium]